MARILKVIGAVLIILGIIGPVVIVANMDWEDYRTYKQVYENLDAAAMREFGELTKRDDYEDVILERWDDIFGTRDYAEEQLEFRKQVIISGVFTAAATGLSGVIFGFLFLAQARIMELLSKQQIPLRPQQGGSADHED